MSLTLGSRVGRYEIVESDGAPALVLELIEGETLEDGLALSVSEGLLD